MLFSTMYAHLGTKQAIIANLQVGFRRFRPDSHSPQRVHNKLCVHVKHACQNGN